MKRVADKITEHALLRYMEREKGIDVERYRQDFQETLKKVAKITDHALLQDLERIAGIDVERYRQEFEEILNTPRLLETLDFIGKTKCKIRTKGITCCLRGGKITTCYPD